MTSTIERTLPQNLDAERSVLGAIIIENQSYFQVAADLAPDHFFRDAHRRIYQAIGNVLSKKDAGLDFVTLLEELRRAGDLDAVGGPAYVAALTDGVPRSTNVPHYGAIVREKAILRRLIATSERIVLDAYDQSRPAADILANADREIIRLRHGAGSARMRNLANDAPGIFEDLCARAERRGQLTGVPTGFASIDELTSGWQKGDMIVIAARPSIGKTIFAMNTALQAARTTRDDGTARRVAVFSLEMRRVQLHYRLLASITGVDLSRLLAGILTEAEWGLVSEAMTELARLQIFIDDTAARTRWEIRGECRRLMADGGLDLVVVDYFQLMGAGEDSRHQGNRNNELAEISRGLKVMADEIGCPVIVVSQMNRAGEARSDPRPKLSDLRETGALEQDADLVCFLHRKHHKEDGCTNFIVEKARNGPTGTVNLTVQRDCVRFIDGGEEPAPEPAAPQAKQVSFFKNRPKR